MAAEDMIPGLALIGAYLMVSVIIGLALYIYFALALMAIAKKKGVPNAWLAFIPIANLYLMTQIAGLPGLWTLAILLAIIPIVGWIALVGIMAWWWWKIAEALNKPGWWGLVIILGPAIPIVNFIGGIASLVFIGMLAWGK